MTAPLEGPLFDGPPETWPDRIVFISDGSGPPRWHVRDQEALIRALPPCAVVAADRATLTPVGLRIHAATIWLPEAELIEPDDEPDDAPQREGWHWSSGDALSLQTGGRRGMPGLHSLDGHGPDDEHALLAGRPVSVHRYSEVDEDGTECHRAVVGGFLDDLTTLHADVIADSPERRDLLLAALLTLRPSADGER
jgi:hypothetical protein